MRVLFFFLILSAEFPRAFSAPSEIDQCPVRIARQSGEARIVPEKERTEYTPVAGESTRIPYTVKNGSSTLVSRAQARLLRSFRRNSNLTYPQLAERMNVSVPLLGKLFRGDARSLRSSAFEELLGEFQIDRDTWELAGQGKVEGGEDSDVCRYYSPRFSFTRVPFVHYLDPSVLERDLFVLACRADAGNLQPRLLGYFLDRLGANLDKVTQENIRDAQALTDNFLAGLNSVDLRFPVTAHLDQLVVSALAPPPIVSSPTHREPAPQPSQEEIKRPIDWELRKKRAEAILRALDPNESNTLYFLSKVELQPILEALVEIRPTQNFFQSATGITKRHLAALRAGEAVQLRAGEVLRACELLGLPAYPTFREVCQYRGDANSPRFTITPRFRQAIRAHLKLQKISMTELSRAISPTDRNSAYKVLTGETSSMNRTQLGAVLEILQMDQDSAFALLSPGILCDPAIEPERCRREGIAVGDKIFEIITYPELSHAIHDLTNLLVSIHMESDPPRRKLLESEFDVRAASLILPRLRPRLRHPAEKRYEFGVKGTLKAIHNVATSELRFTESLRKRLSAVLQDRTEELNAIPVEQLYPKPFQYD